MQPELLHSLAGIITLEPPIDMADSKSLASFAYQIGRRLTDHPDPPRTPAALFRIVSCWPGARASKIQRNIGSLAYLVWVKLRAAGWFADFDHLGSITEAEFNALANGRYARAARLKVVESVA